MLLPNFKENQQEHLNAIFLSQINLDEDVCMKINTFRIKKGGLSPQKQKIFFKKKSNKMEAFPYCFAFWQGSLYPQNYELAP